MASLQTKHANDCTMRMFTVVLRQVYAFSEDFKQTECSHVQAAKCGRVCVKHECKKL